MDISIHASFLPHDDPDASVTFYRDTLGFEVRNDVAYGGMRSITIGPTPARHVHRPVSTGRRPRPHRRRAPQPSSSWPATATGTTPSGTASERACSWRGFDDHFGARPRARFSRTVRPLPSPEVKRLGLVPRTEVHRNWLRGSLQRRPRSSPPREPPARRPRDSRPRNEPR